MKSIVISFGGSLINVEGDGVFLREFSRIILEASKDYKIFVVVGGGKIARSYIRFGRKLGMVERALDEIGIAVTRLNALLLSFLIGANKTIPSTTSEAADIKDRVVVMGGTTPGHSTDMVGAELAERVHAERFIIATDVDGVYDKDPKKYDDAIMFSKIDVEELMEMCGKHWDRAGKNVVIDGPALEIIERGNFETLVLNGRKLENLKQAIYGKEFIGTKIRRK